MRERPLHLRAGFTIVHMALMLAAGAATASVAIPAWFSRVPVTLDNATLLLARDLREVQNRAAFQRRPLQVVFLEDGRGYEVLDGGGRPVRARIGRGRYRRTYDRDAVFRGVTVAGVEARNTDRIVYGPAGALLDTVAVCLAFRGSERTIRLERGSGRISIDGMEREWLDDGF